jgi:hypothetical protein
VKPPCSRPKGEQIIGRGSRPRTGGEPLSPTPIGAHAVEVLRFAWDEHVLAGGSRERLLTRPAKVHFAETNAMISAQLTPWVIPGSRLLAILSGRARRWVPNRFWSSRHRPKRLASNPLRGCNSDLAQYSHPPTLHHSAWPDSRTTTRTRTRTRTKRAHTP